MNTSPIVIRTADRMCKCGACGEPIEIGERYFYHEGESRHEECAFDLYEDILTNYKQDEQ